MCLMALSAAAGDTVQYTLAACREMALTRGASAQSQQELQLAAEYNRKAALAAMFPKISANGSYLELAQLASVGEPNSFFFRYGIGERRRYVIVHVE